jgi:hypothetical protein
VLTDLLAEVPGSQESERNGGGIAEEVQVAEPLCDDVQPLAVCSSLNIQHTQTTHTIRSQMGWRNASIAASRTHFLPIAQWQTGWTAYLLGL